MWFLYLILGFMFFDFYWKEGNIFLDIVYFYVISCFSFVKIESSFIFLCFIFVEILYEVFNVILLEFFLLDLRLGSNFFLYIYIVFFW